MPTFTNKLAGKKVVLIGGSSGFTPYYSVNNSSRIGFGVAEALVSLEAHVIIISSSKDKVDNALDRLRKSAPANSPIEGIAQSAAESSSIVQILKDLGPFDHLVYTATQFSSLKSGDIDSLKEAFDVKFWTAAFAPKRNFSIRGALNGAVISLTKGLAVDLAENGIRVNTVIPGPVETELWDSAGTSKELLLEGRKRLLVPFVGQPSDVAESYIYFPRADYSTGVTVVIDGGELLVRK